MCDERVIADITGILFLGGGIVALVLFVEAFLWIARVDGEGKPPPQSMPPLDRVTKGDLDDTYCPIGRGPASGCAHCKSKAGEEPPDSSGGSD